MSSKFVFVCLFLVTNIFYVASTDTDIVDATPEEFPYLAMINLDVWSMPCPAALITETYLVTLAMCAHGGSYVRVYLGNRVHPGSPHYTKEEYTQICNSSHIDIHEDFEYRKKAMHYINNIALIKLDKPVILTDQVRPGKLISIDPNTLNEERLAQVIFWRYGASETGMQAETVKILNQTICNSYFEPLFLKDQELCALPGSPHYQGSGYIGNVLTVNKKIAGIQVDGYSKCHNNTTDTSLKCSEMHVFLNIAHFLPWISQKVGVSVEKLTASNL